MNILEINKFHYLRRGAERHYLDVANLLESNDHNVAVFSMQHSKNILSKWENFFVSYVGYNEDDSTVWQRIIGAGRLFWSFEARRKVKALLGEFCPDIVHLHNIYHQLSPSILTPLKQSGAKIMMTVHDYNLISPDKDQYYDEVGRQYWKFLRVKKYGFAKRLLLVLKMYVEKYFNLYEKTVDVFIAPSQFVKETLIQGGMDEQKIVVIPHFIDRTENDAVKNRDAEEKKQALYFGSLSKEKGIAELVQIFDGLQIPLVLAGSPEEGFELPKSKYVKYVGQQGREQIERLIQESSCVVSGSRLPETFGLIALEALSFGKPFFGLRSGAYVEIIEDGENGFLMNDFEDFEEVIRQYFDGMIRFNAEAIQKEAYTKYGAEAYYAKWMEVLK
jgi:glycosyltransferase involved in cell wall biosynthesis